jgi:hypothetical protein
MRGMQCNVEFVYQLSICPKNRGKPRKNLIELAGRRTFRMRCDFYPAVQHLNTRDLTAVPVCAVAVFLKQFVEISLQFFLPILWIRNEQFEAFLIQLQSIELNVRGSLSRVRELVVLTCSVEAEVRLNRI